MILRPLATIHSKGTILKISDREIPFETRLEYPKVEGEEGRRARECVITPDGREFRHETEFLEEFGVRAPWNRETGMVDGKQVQFFPAGPPDAMLIPVHDVTLHFCNYYFRDLAQEEQKRRLPEGAFTKLPLEYVTNLIDLSEKERDMIFRSIQRQMRGKKGEVADPPPPPEPTPEEVAISSQTACPAARQQSRTRIFVTGTVKLAPIARHLPGRCSMALTGTSSPARTQMN